MTDAALDTRGPGDNMPPSDQMLLEEQIKRRVESLPTIYDSLIERRDELLASAARTPETVDDEEHNKKFATLAKLLAALVKKSETERVGEKEKFLEGGRGTDGFFKQITDPAKEAKVSLETRQTEWQRKVAAEERQRRQEEERLAREEADRLAREAAKREQAARDAKSLDDAVAAEAAAKQAAADAEAAAKAAAAKPADLSRTRSDEGAVASLRTWWDFRDIDRSRLDLEALRQHLPEDALEKAVRSFVKAGGRELTGAVIFENSRTVNH